VSVGRQSALGLVPENEDEQKKQSKKDGHVVNGSQHDDKLTAQCRHEAH